MDKYLSKIRSVSKSYSISSSESEKHRKTQNNNENQCKLEFFENQSKQNQKKDPIKNQNEKSQIYMDNRYKNKKERQNILEIQKRSLSQEKKQKKQVFRGLFSSQSNSKSRSRSRSRSKQKNSYKQEFRSLSKSRSNSIDYYKKKKLSKNNKKSYYRNSRSRSNSYYRTNKYKKKDKQKSDRNDNQSLIWLNDLPKSRSRSFSREKQQIKREKQDKKYLKNYKFEQISSDSSDRKYKRKKYKDDKKTKKSKSRKKHKKHRSRSKSIDQYQKKQNDIEKEKCQNLLDNYKQKKLKQFEMLQEENKQFILNNDTPIFNLNFHFDDANQLPIQQKQIEILQKIYYNQVVLISGSTGCGKSTQIPQYIFYFHQLNKQLFPKKLKVIITQPRRIAAKNLAKRVSQELRTQLGDIVGYQVGLDKCYTSQSQLIFVTNGILLQLLVNNKEFINNTDYLILDEVHERDIDSDFILLTVKHLLTLKNKLKVILMSATIDNKLFSKYFSPTELKNFIQREDYFERQQRLQNEKQQGKKSEPVKIQNNSSKLQWGNQNKEQEQKKIYIKKLEEQSDSDSYYEDKINEIDQLITYDQDIDNMDYMKIEDSCPVIQIEKKDRKYTITQYYLDNIQDFSQQIYKKYEEDLQYVQFNQEESKVFKIQTLIAQEILINIIPLFKSSGSILIFLPGLQEILFFIDELEIILEQIGFKHLQVLPLYSNQNDSDILQKVFEKSIQKIIVSTNIAESSITVPDVEYVIDFCLCKELSFDVNDNREKLDLLWTSQASCNQRSGRSGRIRDGICFRLVTQKFFKSLKQFQIPEIQRSCLDKAILKIKQMDQLNIEAYLFENPFEVLGRSIQPPQLDKIKHSIMSLIQMGALNLKLQDNMQVLKITDIGTLYGHLPISIQHSKLILMGFLFGCVKETIVISCILENSKGILKINTRRSFVDHLNFLRVTQEYSQNQKSDIIIHLNLFKQWEQKFHDEKDVIKQTKDLRYRSTAKKYISMQWVQDQCIDFQTLRDIDILQQDIINRLLKQGFNTENFEYSSEQSIYNRIRMALIATYYDNLVKAYVPQPNQKQMKAQKLIVQKHNLQLKNTLSLNTHILQVDDFYNQNYSKIQQICVFYNVTLKQNLSPLCEINNIYPGQARDILLELNQRTASQDIHKIMYLKQILNSKDRQNILNKHKEKDKENYILEKTLIDLGDIECFNQIKFTDYCKGYEINLDQYSINRFMLADNVNQEQFLISPGYYMKSKTTSQALFNSLIPSHFNNIQSMIYLAFSSFVELIPDRKQTKFLNLIPDGKDQRINIDFTLTEQFIEEINEVRQLMLNLLCVQAFIKDRNDSQFIELWEKISKIMFCPKIPSVKGEAWEDEFLIQTYNTDKHELQKNLKIFQKQNKQNRKMKNKQQTNRSFFSPIIKQELYNPLIQFQSEQFNYLTYCDDFNNWKKSIEQQFKKVEFITSTTNTYLCCNFQGCSEHITEIQNLDYKLYNNSRKLRCSFQEVNFLSIEQVMSADLGQNNFWKNLVLQQNQNNLNVVSFVACKQNHIIGYIDDKKYIFINDQSNLKIMYPGQIFQPFVFYKYNIKEIRDNTDYYIRHKNFQKLDFECVICFRADSIKTVKDFQEHIITEAHQQLYEEFVDSIIFY